MRPPLLLLVCACLASLAGAAEPVAVTPCAEVRALGRERARDALPVLVRGVVTLVLPNQAYILQDDTDAIYVSWNGRSFGPGIGAGDRIEVKGETAAGGFAPVVKAHTVTRLEAAELPPAARPALSDLLTGRFDCHRVIVRGVVRRFHVGPEPRGLTRLEIAAAGGVFPAFVPQLPAETARTLIDAELELDGICFSFFNPRGEITGINLRVAAASALTIRRPAPADPFAVPEISPLGLLPFTRDGPSLHRTRLTGTVTLCRPGALLYVQSGHRGFRIYPASDATFQPGEVVEASGFLEAGPDFGVMKEALVRRQGTGTLPDPVPITRAAILAYHPRVQPGLKTEDYDARLVRLVGELTRIDRLPRDDVRLYLEQDGHTVVATLPAGEPEAALARLRAGATLELTGICALTLTSTWPNLEQPLVEDFTVVLQSAASIRVLRQPSWWTVGRLRVLLAATIGALAVALGAVVLLRRIVTTRTRQLTAAILERQQQERAIRDAEVEFAAALRERERLAADLHDTVEQSLTGVALQLDATQRAPDPERAARNLGLATQMLARSREDVRRSVWNLRAQALEGQLLRAALRDIGSALLDGTGLTLTVGGSGLEEPLPDVIAGNLLMLAKEGITNALKHSAATRLEITVDYTPEDVTVTLRDNGQGFTPAEAPGPHQGHFGLTGMKERAARLNGRMVISSQPGGGTVIRITAPRHRPSAAESREATRSSG